MLIAICGTFDNIRFGSVRGNGKTLSAVYLAYLDYLDGRRIFSNFKTSFSDMVKINDLLLLFRNKDLSDCTIIIDEAQMYLNNTGVKTNVRKELIQKFIAQSRKSNIDLILTTQRFLQLHKELRAQVDIVLISVKFHYNEEYNCLTDICNIDRCDKRHAIRIMSMNVNPPKFIKKDNKIVTLNPNIIGKLYNSNEFMLDEYVIDEQKKNKK